MSARRHPAAQGVAGVGAFVALTWPLLVFDRPLYVLLSFFLIWGGCILALFLFSRAPEHDPYGDGSVAPPSEDDARRR